MSSNKNNIKCLIVIIIFTSNLVFSQHFNSAVHSAEIESSNLPLIFIDTDNQIIMDEERITAHMGIIDNGNKNRNFVSDEYNNYNGIIAIELRGSSSSTYPKPQFRFETQDSLGENFNVSLCGLPSENDWILNGPYADKSLVRNVLSYHLSNQIGRYASRTIYCELFLNEEYLGLYILMEKVKRDNNRIDISKLTESDISGDDLTGGYIVKIDKHEGENVEYLFSRNGTPFQYHYPKGDEILREQKEYLESYLNNFESLMNNSNYNDSFEGYETIIDVNSFVDHFILNEFCKNVDAYRLSAFLHKDKDSANPKLIAGPIWDFNLTFGDAWIPEEVGIAEGWQIDYSKNHPSDQFRVPFWWEKLFNDFNFMSKVSTRWNELREDLLSYNSIFNQIDSIVSYIAEGTERNIQKWPENITNTHNDEIIKMKGWILRRLIWMDTNLDRFTDVKNYNHYTSSNKFELFQNYPNPFNPVTSIKYRIGNNNNEKSFTQLNIYNMLGEKIATLVSESQQPGNYSIEWNAQNYPTGVYFYKLQIGSNNHSDSFTHVKKMILLR